MLNYDDFSLRLIALADQQMILDWRNLDRIRINMYNDHLISKEEHNNWFKNALIDKDARYFIFGYKGNPVGFVSFTKIDWKHNRCYWAFYLGEQNIPKGTGAAMEFFALSYIFNQVNIRKLCCEVFVFNSSVIKLHHRFGFVEEGRFIRHYLKNDKYEDIVCLAQFKETWESNRDKFRESIFSR